MTHEPVLVVLCAAVYDVLLLRLNTVGKALMGLRVVGPVSGLDLKRVVTRALVTTALPGAGAVLGLTGLGLREPALMAGLGWQQPWVFVGEPVAAVSSGWLAPLLLTGGFALLMLSVVEALDLRGTRTWHDRRAGTAVVRLKARRRANPLG
ncbi:RDD family protein [Lentzea fradiae]|uniref:RDD family protein n=1 Tax=Lentzea fradiae TaxID=200378 RepID=UPI00159FDB37|nr:RDD family protein [Lentzea fradiae]